jgi:hypothetical protein
MHPTQFMARIRSCQENAMNYTRYSVRLNLKILRLVLIAALWLPVMGCGGITATKSISPLDFFMPGIRGLLQADPPPVCPDHDLPVEDPVMQLAQI